MGSERDLRSEFGRALEAVTPPAPWLPTAVREELRHRQQKAWRPSTGSLAAGLLAVLLIAALVVGVRVWRNGDLNHGPMPAGGAPTIKQYQALVSRDDLRLDNTSNIDCTTYVYPNCLAPVAVANAAAHQWLDDLSGIQPPARFAAVDALLRRHLALLISGNADYVAAYTAKDMQGRATFTLVVNDEQSALDTAVQAIDASSQDTILGYSAGVQLGKDDLLACAVCQGLISQSTVSCPASQTPTCADEIDAVGLQVEAFQEDLVRYYAPDSLVANDRRLQADLLATENALDAMTSALSTGVQVALQTAFSALRQALGRVDADAASIAGSN